MTSYFFLGKYISIKIKFRWGDQIIFICFCYIFVFMYMVFVRESIPIIMND